MYACIRVSDRANESSKRRSEIKMKIYSALAYTGIYGKRISAPEDLSNRLDTIILFGMRVEILAQIAP
jgi:hypothetical protein